MFNSRHWRCKLKISSSAQKTTNSDHLFSTIPWIGEYSLMGQRMGRFALYAMAKV